MLWKDKHWVPDGDMAREGETGSLGTVERTEKNNSILIAHPSEQEFRPADPGLLPLRSTSLGCGLAN